jgi:hypothetical protein
MHANHHKKKCHVSIAGEWWLLIKMYITLIRGRTSNLCFEFAFLWEFFLIFPLNIFCLSYLSKCKYWWSFTVCCLDIGYALFQLLCHTYNPSNHLFCHLLSLAHVFSGFENFLQGKQPWTLHQLPWPLLGWSTPLWNL